MENISTSKELKEKNSTLIDITNKTKLIFFVKQGMDSFLGDIIKRLSEDYSVRKIIVTDLKQIDGWMEWADMCWFEWCDELVIYGSKLPIASEKKIICRLHSYEAFTYYPYNVNWNNVDKIIFIAEHMKNFAVDKFKIDNNKAIVISNGINLEKYTFKERKPGFNIAYVGYINYKKGPMLLLHTFKAIYDIDNRYKLYIAGKFQDDRYLLYFNQMINEFHIEKNVFYQGWQNNLDEWFEDKSYVLCTSVLESQNMSVMEAMSKGIKPLVHNFVGAKSIYNEKFVWNTIDEAISMLVSKGFNSIEYRKFIEDNYSLEKQIDKFKKIIQEVKKKDNIITIVKTFLRNKRQNKINLKDCTLLITEYNRGKMLKEDLLNGFKFGIQNKIIVDDCSTKEIEEFNEIEKIKGNIGIENIIRHKNNKGVTESRNTGIKNIITKNTIVLDDDDMLLCIDENEMEKDYRLLDEDAVIIIPRYIINLYEDYSLEIGYDRKLYEEMKSMEVLKDISSTSEIKALLAGAISKTNQLLKYNSSKSFIVSEDFIILSRLFANNLYKKVIVSENYVHVRRINKNSLSKTVSKKKVALSLISQCVSCYYCINNNIFNVEAAFNYMIQRGKLLEKIYAYGSQFEDEMITYLKGEIKEDIFIKYLNNLDIKCKDSIDEICEEINLMKKIIKENNDEIGLENTKKKFVTIFPETENSHLAKDVGMIPFVMYNNFNYDSKIVCYKNGDYPYLDKEVKGLKIEFIGNSCDSNLDVQKYLMKNANNIDILHLFHLCDRTINWIYTYKKVNPDGKIYLKLDANINITKLKMDESVLNILKMCTLISVETKYLYRYLNEKWALRVEYIPNGFYDYGERIPVSYSEKENIICTVGRIGLYVKANEILLGAFKIASTKLLNWKLKIIGPICEEFKSFISIYFSENPELKERVIFTGEIIDKQILESEYRKAKIFCLTSRIESFGIVFVEAAKNGCFIISSDIIPAWDITDNKKYGDIFEVDNIQELSQMIISNAENDRKLKENCNKIQEFAYDNFRWENIGKSINEFLTKKSSTQKVKNNDELQEIKEIIKNGQKNENPNDQVFIDRLIYNINAFKMEFWENHFELDAIKMYPEIRGKILDFGCGTGHMDILLAREGKIIHGIDLSPVGINIANYFKEKEMESVRRHVQFTVEDITKAPQNDELYDSVWTCHVFEHIANIKPIIDGLRKRVKIGAYMLISVPLGYAYDDPGHINHFFNPEELKQFLKSYIEVVDIKMDNKNKVLRALCKF